MDPSPCAITDTDLHNCAQPNRSTSQQNASRTDVREAATFNRPEDWLRLMTNDRSRYEPSERISVIKRKSQGL
jgi:hypothetical protein